MKKNGPLSESGVHIIWLWTELTGNYEELFCRRSGMSGISELSLQIYKKQPQILDRFMHGGQKFPSNLGQVYAREAETSLKSGAGLCTRGINFPQIWGKFMHGRQKLPSNPGQVYAWGPETSLKSGAGLCTRGRNFPQIRGRFMHEGQKLPPDPGHINEIPKWSVPNPEQLFLARFEGRTGFARMPEVDKSQVVNQITTAQDICAD